MTGDKKHFQKNITCSECGKKLNYRGNLKPVEKDKHELIMVLDCLTCDRAIVFDCAKGFCTYSEIKLHEVYKYLKVEPY